MQKQCTQCQTAKPATDFIRRAASKDGYTAACAECLRSKKVSTYREHPVSRRATLERVKRNRRDRFEADPAYRRAVVLWGSTRRRTKIPPWVVIRDFVPVCRAAELLGPEFHVDHIIPLNHPLVCGLHTPNNVRVMYGQLNVLRRNAAFTLDEMNSL